MLKTALSLSRVTRRPRDPPGCLENDIHVAAIHHHDGARRPLQGARHPDLVSLAIGDYPIAGQTTVVIEKKMQFDGPLGAPELRPIESRQTEIDDSSIQAIKLVLETKGLRCRQRTAALQAVGRKPLRRAHRDDARWHRKGLNAPGRCQRPDD